MRSNIRGNVIFSILEVLILAIALLIAAFLIIELPEWLSTTSIGKSLLIALEKMGAKRTLSISEIIILSAIYLLIFSSLFWILFSSTKEKPYFVAQIIALVSYILSLIAVIVIAALLIMRNEIPKVQFVDTAIACLVLVGSIAVPIIFMHAFKQRMNVILASILTYILSPIFIAIVVIAIVIFVMFFLLKIIFALMGHDTSSWKLPLSSKDKDSGYSDNKTKNKYEDCYVQNKYQGVKFSGFTEIDNNGFFETSSAFDQHKYCVDYGGTVKDMFTEQTVGEIVDSNETFKDYDLILY